MIGTIADITALLSFIISIFTFRAAHGAKKAVTEYKNVRRYDEEIDVHIEKLEGLHETISNGDAYGEKILKDVYNELETVLIQFKQIVKPFSKKIQKLQTIIDKTYCQLNTDHNFNKRKIDVELNRVIEHLKKMEKENKM